MIEIVDKYYKCEKCGRGFKSKEACKNHEENECEAYVRINLIMNFYSCKFSLSPQNCKPAFNPDKYEIITDTNGYSVYTRSTEEAIREGKRRLVSHAETTMHEYLNSLGKLKEELK